MYELEYADGHKAAMSANAIAKNLLSQVNPDEHCLLTFDCITGHWTDGTKVKSDDAFITTSNGVKQLWQTTIRWKDGKMERWSNYMELIERHERLIPYGAGRLCY